MKEKKSWKTAFIYDFRTGIIKVLVHLNSRQNYNCIDLLSLEPIVIVFPLIL